MHSKPGTHHAPEPFVRRHRPIFVGLFVLVPVIVVPALMLYTALKNDGFQQWCTLHVVYENSLGLKRGDKVSMSGIAIGHVKEVDLIKQKEIHVNFDVSERHRHLVRRDTKARLKQRGFVGDWEIELTGGTAAFAEVEEGDTLMSEKTPSIDGMIELAVGVIDTATALLSDVAAIVNGIANGEGTVGQALKNDTLFWYLNQIGANAVGITSDVRTVMRDARGTVRNVDSLLLTLTGVGKDGAAFVDTLMSLINTVNKSIDEVGKILKNVRTVSDDAPELMDRLQQDLGEVELMLRSFQEGWLFKNIGGNAPKNPHLADTP